MKIKRKIQKLFICKVLTRNILSDKAYYWYNYLVLFGKTMSYKNPSGFNAKIQWLKVYYRHPEMVIQADKFRVREYVKNTIGEEFLVPLVGVFQHADEISWENLPERFVLKANHGTGWNFICNDKKQVNPKKMIKTAGYWLNQNLYNRTREWQYKNIKPLILCEENINSGNEPLLQLNIHCYSGVPRFIIAFSYGEKKRGIYDIEWNKLTGETTYREGNEISKPHNLKHVLEVATKLAGSFPFVRVDLMLKNKQVYFGELTFTPAQGFVRFKPKKLDEIFGKYLVLPEPL